MSEVMSIDPLFSIVAIPVTQEWVIESDSEKCQCRPRSAKVRESGEYLAVGPHYRDCRIGHGDHPDVRRCHSFRLCREPGLDVARVRAEAGVTCVW